MSRAWPFGFILLGAYLVYEALRDRGNGSQRVGSVAEKKEF
jgi:hypothetical protein